MSLDKILLAQGHPVGSISCYVTRTMYLRYVLTAAKHLSLCLLSVLARDGGVPSLSSTATIICTIEDENDHSPELIAFSHDIEVLENQDPGVVYTVLAFDMDADNNGAVTYHIAGEYWEASILWVLTKWMVWPFFCFGVCCIFLQNVHQMRTAAPSLTDPLEASSAYPGSTPSKFSKVGGLERFFEFASMQIIGQLQIEQMSFVIFLLLYMTANFILYILS